MPAPIFYGVNRLETATVTATSTLTDRPLVRLADRFIGPRWEGTGPIVWDQGATPSPFDTLVGAPGHNLAGATLTVETAADPGFTTPTTLGTAVATAAAFRIPCTGTVARYSRLVITGPITIELAELWASVAVPAPGVPLLNTSPNFLGNFQGQESEAGAWMAYVRSAPRWEVAWDIPGFTRPVRDSFVEFFQGIAGGAKPFFVVDDEGVLRWARWMNPTTAFSGLLPTQYRAMWALREVLD
jgi:hypothetical protein